MKLRSSLGPLVLAGLISACSSSPVSPLPATPSVTLPPAPAPSPVVPGSAAPAGTYVFSDTGLPVAFYTRESRFVLGDDGRFALQYTGLGKEYRGTYIRSESTGLITFVWEGSSAAGPWEATGSLKDDVLTVFFNIIMQLSDFESANYRRAP
jgi:hypothetical protein